MQVHCLTTAPFWSVSSWWHVIAHQIFVITVCLCFQLLYVFSTQVQPSRRSTARLVHFLHSQETKMEEKRQRTEETDSASGFDRQCSRHLSRVRPKQWSRRRRRLRIDSSLHRLTEIAVAFTADCCLLFLCVYWWILGTLVLTLVCDCMCSISLVVAG